MAKFPANCQCNTSGLNPGCVSISAPFTSEVRLDAVAPLKAAAGKIAELRLDAPGALLVLYAWRKSSSGGGCGSGGFAGRPRLSKLPSACSSKVTSRIADAHEMLLLLQWCCKTLLHTYHPHETSKIVKCLQLQHNSQYATEMEPLMQWCGRLMQEVSLCN